MNSIIHCLLNIFGFKLIVILYMCVFISTQVHIILGGGGYEQTRIQNFILEERPVFSRGLGLSKSPAGPGQSPMGESLGSSLELGI